MSGLSRGDGLLLQDVDFSQQAGVERFHCENCGHDGILTVGLKCGACGSDSVLPFARIVLATMAEALRPIARGR